MVVLACAVLLVLPAPTAAQAEGDELPRSVYEADGPAAQVLDYDPEAQRFPAHEGWLDDQLIHYYKFRVYAADTYDGFGPGEPNRVPVAPMYLATTSVEDPWANLVPDQPPIIAEYPTPGNEDYSDFVRVHWVLVDDALPRGMPGSVDAIESQDLTTVESDVIANVPVVPPGSELAHPDGTGTAPIEPLTVLYEGNQAQAFVFETTSSAFAEHFNPRTRTDDAAEPGSGFEIAVTPGLASRGRIAAIPIWHLNQYTAGVEPGVNHGGPWSQGQRNVIDADRPDPTYSPLWQIAWVEQTPPNHTADAVSDASDIRAERGFEVSTVPVFVNCPNVGPHGGTGPNNPDRVPRFDIEPTLRGETSTRLAGALVMEPDRQVSLYVDGDPIASTRTNPMGAYSFTLTGEALDPGEHTVEARDGQGDTLATWTVHGAEPPADEGTFPAWLLFLSAFAFAAVAWWARPR